MKKVLIANRGEIAVRIINTCKEMGIKTVAVHSLEDAKSLHAKLADESVCIGDNSPQKSYLNIKNILSAAEITGADSIHPGYGFLSENYTFASLCQKTGLCFIGPKPENIKQLADKNSAKLIAKKCKIPLIPGSSGSIDEISEAQRVAKEIGFPIIIKAASGGGGRGMKIVRDESKLPELFHLAQKEAFSYFSDASVFIEKYLENPKHIEVQIIGDHFGQVEELGTRECTIQHRHQKILEESPASSIPKKTLNKMCEASIRLAKEIKYSSLGTIEFLYQDEKFYFIEANTRVQVEHPVTEESLKLDLIKEQILVSQGHRLKIRNNKPNFHAIECRINAAHPDSLRPCPGTVEEFHIPSGFGVRCDSFIYRGYKIPPYYDSLIAKIITHGQDRNEAIRRMKRALNEFKIDGIKSTKELHQKILNDKAYLSNNFSTRFLENYIN